jgi:hypothetical protein
MKTNDIGIITKRASFIAALTKYVGANISSIADIATQQTARAIIYGKATGRCPVAFVSVSLFISIRNELVDS